MTPDSRSRCVVVGYDGSPASRAALARAADRAGAAEQEAGADLEGVDWEPEVIGDPPARAIAHVAATRDADEIVLGTHGFGRARALLGSVAHEVIHLAECPVTVIPERAVERAEARAKSGVAS